MKKKKRYDKLNQDVNSLNSKLDTLGFSTEYDDLLEKRSMIKDLEKKAKKYSRIRNLKTTAAISILLLPAIVFGSATFVIMDKTDSRPYVPDVYYESVLEAETIYNNGDAYEFEISYDNYNPNLLDLYTVSTPWKEKDGHYERFNYSYFLRIKDKDKEKYLKASDKIVENLDPSSIMPEFKEHLDSNDSTDEVLTSLTSFKKSEEKKVKRVNDVGDTVVYSIVHLGLTASGWLVTVLIFIYMNMGPSELLASAKQSKRDRDYTKLKIKELRGK